MDATGGLPVFSNAANAGNHLNNHLHMQQQQQLIHHQINQQHHQQQQQQQQQQQEQLTPKRQAVVDRLRRRIETYRRRQTDCTPRFEQTFTGVCEQQSIETNVLQKRYLESKAKRQAKKTDKKQTDNSTLASNLQSSVHVKQNFLKRPVEDHDSGADSFEPPLKLQHNGSENLTKFSVEIVQQLEFTTSAANSQPQQISTNVTVKALTNASVKSDGSNNQQQQQQSGGNNQSGNNSSNNNQNTANNQQHHHHQQSNATQSPHMHDLGDIGFKQEPDDFADLEQCAAALEKDVAANGHFPGLSDLIGDDTVEENDTFKELISDLSDFHPELLLNFEEKPKVEVKLEDAHLRHNNMKGDVTSQHQLDNLGLKNSGSPMTQYSMHPQFNNGTDANNSTNNPLNKQRGPYNPNGSLNELSPAAQTLKHMAEQHQVKNAMNMQGYARQTGNMPSQGHPVQNNTRFNEQFNQPFNPGNEYLNNPNTNPNAAFHKNNVQPFPGADMIKQEMMGYTSPNDFDLKRLSQMPNQKIGPGAYAPKPGNQQYSPYGSPGGIANHGSPGGNFMPNRGNTQSNTGASPRPNQNNQGANNQSSMTLNMKQTQQLNISQQGPGGHGIQVSAGQHLHLSSDLKNGGVSVAAQQGMFFNQQQQQQQQQANNQNQAQPNASQQQQQQQQNQQANTQQNNNAGVNNGGNSHNNSNNSQQNHQNSNPNGGQSNETFSVSQSQSINFGSQSLRQQRPNQHNNTQQQQQQQQQQGNNSVINQGNMSGGNISTNEGMTVGGGLGSQMNPNVMSNGQNPGMTGMQNPTMGQMNGGMMGQNTSNMMGSQTNGMGMNNMCMGNMRPNAGMMGANNTGMTPNGMQQSNMSQHEQMKFIQQQRLMQMQQRMMTANNRGPPPEYKAPVQGMMNQAQMMAQHQGGGRFPTAAAMRRMNQQPIPPSGPMMRSQHPMYMQQRSMNVSAGGYAGGQRPPNVQVGQEGMPMGAQANQEWRQLLMQQQQNMSFNNNAGNMRPNNFNQPGQNFQMQGQTNVGPGNNGSASAMQMNTHLQQQLLRSQHQQQNQNAQNQQQQQQPNALMAQQNPALNQQLQNQMQQQQQMMNQMNVMNATHMTQTQTLAIQQQQQQSMVNGQFVASQTQQQTQQTMITSNSGTGTGNATNNSNNVISSSDFNLDFLDSSGTFEAQDLLNSLDNDNFNLQDIL
uniref:CSON000975 protein n=1 Tax=Culicoides sonorensis TaxID=179676 RepID=A0A336LQF4_CULSO